MATESACLVIADISGYTGYLAGVELDHAQDILADLMGTIVSALRPGFRLAKLEGDAVFVYSPTADGMPHGDAVLACMVQCYAGFRTRLAEAQSLWQCTCDACARVTALDLKFVIHAGPFVIHTMGGNPELIGAEVVMVHRLLKNHATDLVGTRPYALITDAAAELLDVTTDRGLPLVEQYEHLQPISTRVIPLA